MSTPVAAEFHGMKLLNGQVFAPATGIELVRFDGIVVATFERPDTDGKTYRYFVPFTSIERLWIEQPK